jgi:transcriptional regulator with XRE-family HTH domain
MDNSSLKTEPEVRPSANDSHVDKRKALVRRVSERIKALAKDKGVSPKAAMVASGVQGNLLTHMDKRGSMPVADAFIRIADYFNVSTDFIFGRTDRNKEYANILLDFEEALIKEGVSEKSMAPNLKKPLFKFILNKVAFFMKVVSHKPKSAQARVKTDTKSSGTHMRLSEDERSIFAREIAGRIKALSKAKGIPYGKVLFEIGYRPEFIENMLIHGSVPFTDSLLPIADYFDVSVDFLLGRPERRVEYSKMLSIIEDTIKLKGLKDESVDLDDCDLFCELIENQIDAFLRIKAAQMDGPKIGSRIIPEEIES